MNYTKLESLLRSATPTFAGCTTLNVSPQCVYDLGFGNKSNEFFKKLIELCGHTNSKINISPWEEHSFNANLESLKCLNHFNGSEANNDSVYEEEMTSPSTSLKSSRCEHRKITVEQTASSFSWLARKSICVRMEQFIFFRENGNWSLYCMCQSETDGKKSDYIIIEKWDVRNQEVTNTDLQENNDNNSNIPNLRKRHRQSDENNRENIENSNDSIAKKTTIGVQAALYWEEDMRAPSAFLRAKSSRYCHNRFDKWKELILSSVVDLEKKLESNGLNEKFKGKWFKLGSYHQIIINNGKILYEDGSSFIVDISYDINKRIKLVAKYSEGPFEGKLSLNDDCIEWNNGSVWIHNGFDKFCGEYKNENNELIKIINDGKIHWLNDNTTIIKGLLETKDTICCRLNNELVYGKFSSDNTSLEWTNGTVWKLISHEKLKISPLVLQNDRDEGNNEEIDIIRLSETTANTINKTTDIEQSLKPNTFDVNNINDNKTTSFPDPPELSLTEQFENLEFDRTQSISQGETGNDWLLVMVDESC